MNEQDKEMMQLDHRIIKLINFLGYDLQAIRSIYFNQDIGCAEPDEPWTETVTIKIRAHRGHAQNTKLDADKILIPKTLYVKKRKDN